MYIYGVLHLFLSNIGIGICIIAMLVCSSSLYLIVNQRKLMKIKQRFFRQNGGLILQQQLSRQDNSTNVVKIFTTKELEKAINNYDENLIIGRGGFGTVYKGFYRMIELWPLRSQK